MSAFGQSDKNAWPGWLGTPSSARKRPGGRGSTPPPELQLAAPPFVWPPEPPYLLYGHHPTLLCATPEP